MSRGKKTSGRLNFRFEFVLHRFIAIIIITVCWRIVLLSIHLERISEAWMRSNQQIQKHGFSINNAVFWLSPISCEANRLNKINSHYVCMVCVYGDRCDCCLLSSSQPPPSLCVLTVCRRWKTTHWNQCMSWGMPFCRDIATTCISIDRGWGRRRHTHTDSCSVDTLRIFHTNKKEMKCSTEKKKNLFFWIITGHYVAVQSKWIISCIGTIELIVCEFSDDVR